MDFDLALGQRYQAVTISALLERVEQTKARGNPFGFEVRARGLTTAVLARRWQTQPDQLPFSRVFNYTLSGGDPSDTFLEDALALEPGLVVETNLQQTATENYLRTQGLSEAWRIPWLHQGLESTQLQIPQNVELASCADLPQFAQALARGYGYQGIQLEQWRTFFEQGYAAKDFHCFWIKHQGIPVACGVVFIAGEIALVDGASTLQTHRGQGLQKALLVARLAFAQQQGCLYAFSRTGRGSISQRNLQTVGMSLAWESIAWRKP